MKKQAAIIALIGACVVAFALVGCGSEATQGAGGVYSGGPTTTTMPGTVTHTYVVKETGTGNVISSDFWHNVPPNPAGCVESHQGQVMYTLTAPYVTTATMTACDMIISVTQNSGGSATQIDVYRDGVLYQTQYVATGNSVYFYLDQ